MIVLATGELRNTGQAVLPCRLAGCDLRFPYRVTEDTTRFLTLESQQGEDLNDDGDRLDLLVQLYNAGEDAARVVGEVVDPGGDPALGSDPCSRRRMRTGPLPDSRSS